MPHGALSLRTGSVLLGADAEVSRHRLGARWSRSTTKAHSQCAIKPQWWQFSRSVHSMARSPSDSVDRLPVIRAQLLQSTRQRWCFCAGEERPKLWLCSPAPAELERPLAVGSARATSCPKPIKPPSDGPSGRLNAETLKAENAALREELARANEAPWPRKGGGEKKELSCKRSV